MTAVPAAAAAAVPVVESAPAVPSRGGMKVPLARPAKKARKDAFDPMDPVSAQVHVPYMHLPPTQGRHLVITCTAVKWWSVIYRSLCLMQYIPKGNAHQICYHLTKPLIMLAYQNNTAVVGHRECMTQVVGAVILLRCPPRGLEFRPCWCTAAGS